MTKNNLEKIESKLEPDPFGGCLLWTGKLTRYGYGNFKFQGKTTALHRFIYEKKIGPIPRGMSVCHKCDVRPCGNHHHYFLGTLDDNNKDRARKGRTNRNLRAWTAKFNLSTILLVRKLRSSGLTFIEIGDLTGMSRANAHLICQRKTWADIQ